MNANIRPHFNAAIEAMDTEIGRLFSSMSPSVLNNTWVIFIGDNGTPPQTIQSPYTPAHGKNTLYEGGVRVPLLISGPSITSPDREETNLVHAVDLYSTILELAGIDAATTQPASKPIVSRSLVPYLENNVTTDSTIISQLPGSSEPDDVGGVTTRSGDYKYILFTDGVEQLFDLSSDPNETDNLLEAPLTNDATQAYQTLITITQSSVATVNPLSAPLETQWQTLNGAEYARIFLNQSDALNNLPSTTWEPSGTVRNGGQPTPAYAGVESVRVSPNWVYVKGSGLPHYTMGPWYFNEEKTRLFVNLPSQWDMLTRLPRRPQPAAQRTNTNFGPIAIWVNSAIIHNQLDAFYWDGSADVDENAEGTEYWTRNARLAEGPTFDPAGAHQPFTGESHHHISPYALRHELGDHMDYDASTHTYTEAANTPQHSPVLGWGFDGYPIYGPYGYSEASDSTSEIRRMDTGYVLRDGQNNTTNLTVTGRTTLPLWATEAGHGESDASDSATGPDVDLDFPLGWYLQDHAYLGNLGFTIGHDFDLDESNGRWCVTPEFPSGTYAYFITIDQMNEPVYPYIIGRQYYGVKQGGNFAAASTVGFNELETPISTLYKGGPQSPPQISAIHVSNAEVTLTWNNIEGGNYTIEESSDLSDWDTEPSTQVSGQGPESLTDFPKPATLTRFYRATLDSLAPYQENPYE